MQNGFGEICNAAIRDGLIEGETYDELEFYGNDLMHFPAVIRPQIYFWITSKHTKNFYVNKMQNILDHFRSAAILVLFMERKPSL